jgi:serine protease Do
VRKTTLLIRTLLTLLVLPVFATATYAQAPPQELVSQVKRAVVIVSALDQNGKAFRQGSGFFIDPNTIVTNLHVIESANRIQIKTFNGLEKTVQSVSSSDAKADLAIMQIDTPVPDTTSLQVTDFTAAEGDGVVVVSHPKGSRWKVTAGRVGATWNFEHLGSRMQITASLAPGSSGGPVVNLQGHLIGIAVMHAAGADDLDFAVPVERLKKLRNGNQ